MILDNALEMLVLDHGVSQSKSCQEYWIGGSTDVTAPPSPNTSHVSYFDYIPNDSGYYILLNSIILYLSPTSKSYY